MARLSDPIIERQAEASSESLRPPPGSGNRSRRELRGEVERPYHRPQSGLLSVLDPGRTELQDALATPSGSYL